MNKGDKVKVDISYGILVHAETIEYMLDHFHLHKNKSFDEPVGKWYPAAKAALEKE